MAGTPQPHTGRRRRILLVEDHVGSAQSIGRLLEHFGFDVRIEGDGLAAVLEAPRFAPNVALIDLTLPSLDGFEVARRLRANAVTRSALLIAMTGWGDAEHEARALAAGFDRHLVKPLSMNALFDAVSKPKTWPANEVSPAEAGRETQR